MTYESNTMARSFYWGRGWWGLVVFAACLLLRHQVCRLSRSRAASPAQFWTRPAQ